MKHRTEVASVSYKPQQAHPCKNEKCKILITTDASTSNPLMPPLSPGNDFKPKQIFEKSLYRITTETKRILFHWEASRSEDICLTRNQQKDMKEHKTSKNPGGEMRSAKRQECEARRAIYYKEKLTFLSR